MGKPGVSLYQHLKGESTSLFKNGKDVTIIIIIKFPRGEDDEKFPKAIFWTVSPHDDAHDRDNNLYWTRVAGGLGLEDRKEIESSPASLSSAFFYNIFLPAIVHRRQKKEAQLSNDT